MLSTNAIDSAYALTKSLDERNIACVAAEGTPLAKLVAATILPNQDMTSTREIAIDANLMSTMTDRADAIVGYSEHTACMEEIADYVAGNLQLHIFNARTVVAPFVDEFASRLKASFDMIAGDPSNGMEVCVHSTPSPLAEPQLLESFQRSSEVTVFAPLMVMRLPVQTEEEVRAHLYTGASAVDEQVMRYFSDLGVGWLESTWKLIFCSGGEEVQPGDGLNAYISGRHNVARALFTFLIARRLSDSPLPGTNMTSGAYEQAMIDYRDQAAQRLCREVDLIEREANSGSLIREMTVSPETGAPRIIVNEFAYREYIKSGGTNEALLGNTLRQTPYTATKEVLENAEVLSSQWARHYSYRQATYENRRFNAMRESIMTEYDQLARECSAEDFPLQERAVARALLLKARNKVSLGDLKNLSMLSLRLVCGSRFYKTDAEVLLMSMARAKEANPGMSSTEAASIATVEYIARWVASQITPVGASRMAVHG